VTCLTSSALTSAHAQSFHKELRFLQQNRLLHSWQQTLRSLSSPHLRRVLTPRQPWCHHTHGVHVYEASGCRECAQQMCVAVVTPSAASEVVFILTCSCKKWHHSSEFMYFLLSLTSLTSSYLLSSHLCSYLSSLVTSSIQVPVSTHFPTFSLIFPSVSIILLLFLSLLFSFVAHLLFLSFFLTLCV